jgi:hypothetical protein
MKLSFQSELMHNQKHADVMAPTANFEALQSLDGDALYFSIGSDGVFYLTREVAGARTGWSRIDLSSGLSSHHHGAKIAARCFDVSRNGVTGKIDIALAITVEGVDHLYISYGNENTDDAWSRGVTFVETPYDDTLAAPALEIADLYLFQSPLGEYLVVDALLDSSNDPLKRISRYFVSPQDSQKWRRHLLGEELSAGSVDSSLGSRPGDDVPGIYNFGKFADVPQLFYAPLYDDVDKDVAPNPVRFDLPQGAAAFAVATPADDGQGGGSRVFVAAGGKLYYYAPNATSAHPIVKSQRLTGAVMLRAACGRRTTAVWGINQQGELFYTACRAGDELRPNAWSQPVPLCADVERIGAYLDQSAESHVIFAHISGRDLLQLSQDPVTSQWSTRRILLPSTDAADLVDYVSFTTHMRLVDDNNVGVPHSQLFIRSTSPVSVYVNDAYHRLSPEVAIQIESNESGGVTIVQETQGLTASGYHVQLGDSGEVFDVNPLSTVIGRIDGVKSGADLAKATAPTGDGARKPVVGGDIDGRRLDAAAQGLQQLKAAAAAMPKDGSTTPARLKARPLPASLAAALAGPHPQSGAPQRIWGLSFDGDAIRYHEGEAAVARFNLAPRAPAAAGAATMATPFDEFGDAIAMAAGDLFAWLKHAFEEVEHFFVMVVDDIQHFVIKIGEELYKIVLDCVAAVTQAIELVFNKIKVFFEDLVKWLGFIFEWGDILRTHRVLKNIFRQYGRRAVAGIGAAKTQIEKSFDGLEANIREWADLPPTSQSIGFIQRSGGSVDGLDHPQSNWALHHARSNLTSATAGSPPAQTGGGMPKLLQDFVTFFEKEGEDFVGVVRDLKTQIIDRITELSPVDVVKRLGAILANTVLDTVKNGTILVVSVLQDFVEGLFDLLEMELSIPVLSPLYRQLTGEELSFLDLVTLIVAAPTTIVYKIAHNAAPFPDNAFTAQLIGAADFDAIRALYRPRARAAAVGLGRDATAAADFLDDSQTRLANFICNIVGVFGSSVVAIAGGWKEYEILALEEGKDAVDSLPVNAVAAAGYLFYVAPDIAAAISSSGAEPYVIWNDFMTRTTFLKCLVDNLLPFSPQFKVFAPIWGRWTSLGETALNFIWLGPAVWAYIKSSRQGVDVANLMANVFFDASGMITPLYDPRNYPKEPFQTRKAFASLAWHGNCALMLGYSASCIAAAALAGP